MKVKYFGNEDGTTNVQVVRTLPSENITRVAMNVSQDELRAVTARLVGEMRARPGQDDA